MCSHVDMAPRMSELTEDVVLRSLIHLEATFRVGLLRDLFVGRTSGMRLSDQQRIVGREIPKLNSHAPTSEARSGFWSWWLCVLGDEPFGRAKNSGRARRRIAGDHDR